MDDLSSKRIETEYIRSTEIGKSDGLAPLEHAANVNAAGKAHLNFSYFGYSDEKNNESKQIERFRPRLIFVSQDLSE